MVYQEHEECGREGHRYRSTPMGTQVKIVIKLDIITIIIMFIIMFILIIVILLIVFIALLVLVPRLFSCTASSSGWNQVRKLEDH